MVKSPILIKSKSFLKEKVFLAVTSILTAFLFSANFVSAAEMKIDDEKAERVKTALGIVKTASNFGGLLIDGKNFKTILNTVISGGEATTNATYGLFVLSAINEMEFMDLVLSQDYKNEARDYFNNVLDERTNLRSYWKGIGFDLPKVLSGQITGPMGALTLNTFAITDKIIQIFTAFDVLKKEKQYDGLWYYFDFRRGGDSHEEAWKLVEAQMGFAANTTSFHRTEQRQQEKKELEQQFASLYDKWGPYATPDGISDEYKEQFKGDLRNTLVAVVEKNKNAFVDEGPSLWDKFLTQLANIKNALVKLTSQINPFRAGPLAELETFEEIPESEGISTEIILPEDEKLMDVGFPLDFSLSLPPEESADVGSPLTPLISLTTSTETMQEVEGLVATSTEPEPTPSPTPEPQPVPLKETSVKPILCQKEAGEAARQYRILINEIAWMGSNDSSNSEWIELKNIWGISINLSGWQLQDKDQQIKIIFGEQDILPAQGFYLLERTDDNSAPQAEADLIYTGALGNSNEALYLFDNQCNLEDEVLANPNWSAGDNSEKKTMQRFDAFYWYSQKETPGSENLSPSAPIYRRSAVSETVIVSTQTPRIFITEVQIAGPNGEKDDFVELYNPNNQEVNLTDWYLQRKTEIGQDFSSYVSKSLFSGKSIQAKDYFLITNASSSLAIELIDIFVDNPLTEKNALILKGSGGDIIDEIYTDSPSSGISFGKKWSSDSQGYLPDFENQVPTPRAQNQSFANEVGGGEEGEDDEGDTLNDNFLPIVFNEIAWMGTEANSADEWIELRNNTNENVDLTGWMIRKNYENWIEFSSSTISAGGYFLLERTDDDTVSDITADQIYAGALSNNGEILELYDELGNLADSVDASFGWPAGDNRTKQTMERIGSLSGTSAINWASNNRITRNGLDVDGDLIYGTPKAENSVSKSFTEITGGIIFEEDFTLTYFGSPYVIDGSVKVESGVSLTIEPGVIVKFKESNNGWHSLFTIEGELKAISGGESDKKIIFTSFNDDWWDGVYFKESQESKLDNVIIRYAGKIHQSSTYGFPAYSNGAVKIEGGQVVIENSTIESSQTEGLRIINSSPRINNVTFLNNNFSSDSPAVFIEEEDSSPVIASSTFRGNKLGISVKNGASPLITDNVFEENDFPIKIDSAYPYFSGNSAQNNLNGDGIFFTGLISKDVNWQDDLPYIIENNLIIANGADLIIEPDAVVKFDGGSKISVEGNLLVRGSEDNPVIFTSISDAGYGSYYIYFAPSSENSVLKNTIVRYGGTHINPFAGYKAAIVVEGASLTILDSVIENNFFAGVYLMNSDSVIQGTIFKNNNTEYGFNVYSQGLYLVNSPNIDLAGSYFKGNYYGIYIEGECPSLTGVGFGGGDDINVFDIYPDNCSP